MPGDKRDYSDYSSRSSGSEPRRRSRAPGVGAMQEAGPFLGLGLQVAGGLLFFIGAGYWADGFFGTTPWGMVLGAVVGMVGVIFLLIRVADEASAKEKARRERKAEDEREN